MTAETVEKKAKVGLCDPSKLKVGDVYTRYSVGRVIAASATSVQIESDGKVWRLDPEIVAHEFHIAGQFEEEEKLSRTNAIKALEDYPRTACAVCFTKKLDPKTVGAALAEGKGDKTDRQWNKIVKDSLEGEERIMIGYHTRQFDEHGRLKFQESVEGRTQLRLIDPRTIKWVIINRRKITVSK